MSFTSENIGKVIKNKVNSTVPVYPGIAPQATALPYLVYEVLRNDPEEVKEGTWVDNVTMFLYIYSSTYSDANAKALTIRGILNRLTGTVESVPLSGCNFITESDDYDSELKAFIKIQEYKFRINN